MSRPDSTRPGSAPSVPSIQNSRVKSSINCDRINDAKTRLITDIDRVQQEFEEKRRNSASNTFPGSSIGFDNIRPSQYVEDILDIEDNKLDILLDKFCLKKQKHQYGCNGPERIDTSDNRLYDLLVRRIKSCVFEIWNESNRGNEKIGHVDELVSGVSNNLAQAETQKELLGLLWQIENGGQLLKPKVGLDTATTKPNAEFCKNIMKYLLPYDIACKFTSRIQHKYQTVIKHFPLAIHKTIEALQDRGDTVLTKNTEYIPIITKSTRNRNMKQNLRIRPGMGVNEWKRISIGNILQLKTVYRRRDTIMIEKCEPISVDQIPSKINHTIAYLRIYADNFGQQLPNGLQDTADELLLWANIQRFYLEFGREHEAFMTLPNLPNAKKIRYGIKQSRPALMSFEPHKFDFEGCVKFNTSARDSWTYLKQHYGNPKTEDPLISAYSAFLHEKNPQKTMKLLRRYAEYFTLIETGVKLNTTNLDGMIKLLYGKSDSDEDDDDDEEESLNAKNHAKNHGKGASSNDLIDSAREMYESDAKFDLGNTLEKLGLHTDIGLKTDSIHKFERLKTSVKNTSNQALPPNDLSRIHLRHLFLVQQKKSCLLLLNQKFAITQKLAFDPIVNSTAFSKPDFPDDVSILNQFVRQTLQSQILKRCPIIYDELHDACVNDNNGSFVIHQQAFNDLETIENEIKTLCSHYLKNALSPVKNIFTKKKPVVNVFSDDNKNRVGKSELGVEDSEASQRLKDNTLNVQTSGAIDRIQVLADAWQFYVGYIEVQMKIVKLLVKNLSNCTEFSVRKSLINGILQMMSRKPRLDLSSKYFIKSLQSETDVLQTIFEILRDIQNKITVSWLGARQHFPKNIGCNASSSSGISEILMQIFEMLESVQETDASCLGAIGQDVSGNGHYTCLMNNSYEPLTKAVFQTVDNKIQIERELLSMLKVELLDLPECGDQFSPEIKSKLLYAPANCASFLDRGKEVSEEIYKPCLVDVIDLRHEILKSCWETEVLNEVYKKELAVLNISKSSLFVRPQHLDDVQKISSKSIFGETGVPSPATDFNMIDQYTPDQGCLLALQEFDELSLVGFSFRTKHETKRFMDSEDCVKLLNSVVLGQQNHVKLIENAIKIRVNCQTWDTFQPQNLFLERGFLKNMFKNVENLGDVSQNIDENSRSKSIAKASKRIQENFDVDEEFEDKENFRRGAVLNTDTSKKMTKHEVNKSDNPSFEDVASNSYKKQEEKLLERIKKQNETLICVQVEKQYSKEQSIRILKQTSMNSAGTANIKQKARFTAYNAYNLFLGQRVKLYQKRSEIVESYTKLITLLDTQFRLRLDIFRFGDPYQNHKEDRDGDNSDTESNSEERRSGREAMMASVEYKNLVEDGINRDQYQGRTNSGGTTRNDLKPSRHVSFKNRGSEVINSDTHVLQNLWHIPHYTDLMLELRDLDFDKQYEILTKWSKMIRNLTILVTFTLSKLSVPLIVVDSHLITDSSNSPQAKFQAIEKWGNIKLLKEVCSTIQNRLNKVSKLKDSEKVISSYLYTNMKLFNTMLVDSYTRFLDAESGIIAEQGVFDSMWNRVSILATELPKASLQTCLYYSRNLLQGCDTETRERVAGEFESFSACNGNLSVDDMVLHQQVTVLRDVWTKLQKGNDFYAMISEYKNEILFPAIKFLIQQKTGDDFTNSVPESIMIKLDQHRHNVKEEFEEIYTSFDDIFTVSEVKNLEFARMLSSLKMSKLNKWRNIVTTLATESFNERDFTDSEGGSLPVNIWRTPELQSEAINPIDCGGTADFIYKMLMGGNLDSVMENEQGKVVLPKNHVKKTIQHLSNMMTRTARKQYETTSIAYERTVRLLQKEVTSLKNNKLSSGPPELDNSHLATYEPELKSNRWRSVISEITCLKQRINELEADQQAQWFRTNYDVQNRIEAGTYHVQKALHGLREDYDVHRSKLENSISDIIDHVQTKHNVQNKISSNNESIQSSINHQNSSMQNSDDSLVSQHCKTITELEDMNRSLRENNHAQKSLIKWRLSVGHQTRTQKVGNLEQEAESWKKSCILLQTVADQNINQLEKELKFANEKIENLNKDLETANNRVTYDPNNKNGDNPNGISPHGDFDRKNSGFGSSFGHVRKLTSAGRLLDRAQDEQKKSQMAAIEQSEMHLLEENDVLMDERSKTSSRMTRMRSTITKLQKDLASERVYKNDAMTRLNQIQDDNFSFSDADSVCWDDNMAGRPSTMNSRNSVKSRNTVSRNTLSRNTVSRNPVSRNTVSRHTNTRNTDTRNTDTRNTDTRNTDTRNTSSRQAITRNTVTREPPPTTTRNTVMNRTSTSMNKNMSLLRESRARPITHAGKYENFDKPRSTVLRPKSGNDAVVKESAINCVGQPVSHNAKRSSVLDAISRGLVKNKIPPVQDLN